MEVGGTHLKDLHRRYSGAGSSLESHLKNLDAVLDKLEKAGLRLNKEKCLFLQPKLEYLGYVIDETGIHPTQGKVRAIQEVPTPTNVKELRSFLGFLPDMSSMMEPLYTLLGKDQKWS